MNAGEFYLEWRGKGKDLTNLIEFAEAYHQHKLASYGDLADVRLSLPSDEDIKSAAVRCNPNEININPDYHFISGAKWMRSKVAEKHQGNEA